MNVVRSLLSLGFVVSIAALVGIWFSAESQAQATDRPIVGAWTRNRELSNATQTDTGNDGHDDARGRRGGGRRGAGRGGGGFSGGGFGGGASNGPADREAMARVQDAIRDIMNPPDHLIIVQTETMVILTGPDGRTTRLSPDGKKIKDDNTGIERKTRWDGDKLVCEISGAGPGKMTETYLVDPERHQLHIAIQSDNAGGRGGPARATAYVYDADAR